MPQISVDANWLDGLIESIEELKKANEKPLRSAESRNDEAVGYVIRMVTPEKYMQILSGAKPEKLKPNPWPARSDERDTDKYGTYRICSYCYASVRVGLECKCRVISPSF